MILTSLVFAFLPLASAPEAEGVSSRKVMEWIDACEQRIDCLHGFVLLKNGKLVAEGSWAPFDTLNRTHYLSSHSKCFTSTAAGFLVDDGKLDLDECVADILPDLVPADASENLRRVRVRDLMTMTMGSASTAGWSKEKAPDWLRHKLALPVERKPGQHFLYDSDATHLLGVIVSRRSGKPLMDFLKERLFRPLGIEKAWTTYDPTGNACAGWGINMTTREISLMGQLHLDRGVWNGRRILSEDWVSLATTKQTWSGKTPTEFQPENDWLYGFGFSWWRCQHGCYRADGSCGQYTIVFPEHRAVLSLNSDVTNMQHVLDVVWEKFLPALSAKPLPEDAAGAAALRARCAKLALPPVAGTREVSGKVLGGDYAFEKLSAYVSAVRLDAAEDGWKMTLTTEAGVNEVRVGFGRWIESEVVFSPRTYEKLGDVIGRQRVAASGAAQPDGSFAIRMNLLGGIHRYDLVFKRKLFKDVLELQSVGLTWGKTATAHLK